MVRNGEAVSSSRESFALSDDSESRAARRRSRLGPCERAGSPRAEVESAEGFLDHGIPYLNTTHRPFHTLIPAGVEHPVTQSPKSIRKHWGPSRRHGRTSPSTARGHNREGRQPWCVNPRSLRDCRRESPALEGGDESPSSVANVRIGRFRCPRDSIRFIRRGTSAPMPGQSDNLGVPDRSPLVPHRNTSGTDAKQPGTSESADARPNPRGNNGNGRVEDRSNGHLAWPAPRRCANLKLPTQPPAVWLRRWESSPFRAGRMSSTDRCQGHYR